MRNYRIVSLLVIIAGVAYLIGVKMGERCEQAAAHTVVAGCDTCCAPVKPTGATSAKPPAIPTGSGRPCLVVLGSDTCEACRRMAGVLAEVAPKLKGRVDLVRVDTNLYPGEAQRWRLRMAPTQLLVSGKGQELWRHEGYLGAEELLAETQDTAGGGQHLSAQGHRAKR